MGRVRNWDPRVYAEVLTRLDYFGQSASRVAQATELSTLQVAQFKSFLDNNPGKLPSNRVMPTQELVTAVKESLTASIPTEEPPRPHGRPRKAKPAIDTAALLGEVEGCIDLAKQVAAQYGITARSFLHQCLTHARSMG